MCHYASVGRLIITRKRSHPHRPRSNPWVGARPIWGTQERWGLNPINLLNTQLTRLQHIRDSLARVVVAAHRSSNPDQILQSLRWLKVQQCIEYKTGNTQTAQTCVERQYNRIAEWFLQCKLAMQLWSEYTGYFFDNPVNPDLGLRTPGSGRWFGSSPKFNHLVAGPCPTSQ